MSAFARSASTRDRLRKLVHARFMVGSALTYDNGGANEKARDAAASLDVAITILAEGMGLTEGQALVQFRPEES